MQALTRIAAVATMMGATLAANAATFDFSGNIRYHNDVVRIGFTLDRDATDVKVWTDGYMAGLNFDPITAVWSMPAGTLVGENDDNSAIAPGQTRFDSGLTFTTLAAGTYLFTIAAYPNFANGGDRGTGSGLLSEGFTFDGSEPIAIGDWCQPASDDCTNQKGTFWSVHLSGVDSVSPPVPEPATLALMVLGLGALRLAVTRRRQ